MGRHYEYNKKRSESNSQKRSISKEKAALQELKEVH